MYKKFLNAILFGALILGSAGTITSCKDYDDEIDEINQRISGLSGLSDQLSTLTSQLSTAASDASAAKSSAAAALSAAQEAAAKAAEAGDEAAKAAAEAEIATATAKAAAAEAKEAAIAEAKKEIEALAAKIDAAPKGLSDDDIAKLKAEVDKATAKVTAILGHRLQSLAVIPTTHINGIAAITLTSLKYTPQTYLALIPPHEGLQEGHGDLRPVYDYTAVLGKDKKPLPPVYVSTEKNMAYYHVSPNNGVRTQDIKLPIFESTTSTNITRADVKIGQNTPIAPTAYSIDKNVLAVQFKKTVTTPITTAGLAHTDAEENGVPGYKEVFTMVSLKAPIADANLQADETEAFVNSEYVRVEELFKVPKIAHSKQDWTKVPANYNDEVQTSKNPQIGKDGLYVHYHDSICVYSSIVNEYVDIKAQYDQPLDLKNWVTVCVTDEDAENHVGHENLANYKDFGLGFRFYLAKAAYITLGGPDGNSNKTDQQKFAKVSEDGIVESQVYTIDGGSATAVGREPIIRVELWDEVNGNMIDLRYIKIKWVKTTGTKELSVAYPEEMYKCENYVMKLGTEQMNVQIYDKAKEGGMQKGEFHAAYTDDGFDNTNDKNDWGTVELKKNSENDVESYNIQWTITQADFIKKYPDYNKQEKFEFTNTIEWYSATQETLIITFTKVIYKPVFELWGYDGRYWRNTSDKWTIFNVNSIVYNTIEANPAWNAEYPNPTGTIEGVSGTVNNLTNNIYTDLLNGFLDDLSKKPYFGADGAIYYTDKAKAGQKFYYAIEYGDEAFNDETIKRNGGIVWDPQAKYTGQKSLGVVRKPTNYTAFEKLGVRFTYDESKLNQGRHIYYYFDTLTYTYRKGYAYVKNNDKKEPELWIRDAQNKSYFDKKAATIVNYEPNSLEAKELTYNIKLEEGNPNHEPWAYELENPKVSIPTEAAKALVPSNRLKSFAEYPGEDGYQPLIPIKLVADLCDNNYAKVLIKEYDAYVIEPLQAPDPETAYFTDATIGGSTISVLINNLYRSWNADETGLYYPVIPKYATDAPLAKIKAELFGKGKKYPAEWYDQAIALGNFYEAVAGEWDTEHIKTNLQRDADGNLIPTEGVTNGPIPSNTEVTYNADEQTLTYHNYSGTPVNNDYLMYIPVKFQYKWKTYVNYLEVLVKVNKGTDDNQN